MNRKANPPEITARDHSRKSRDGDEALQSTEVEKKLANLLEEAEQAVDRGEVMALEEIVNRVSGDEQLQLSEAIYGMLRLKHPELIGRVAVMSRT